MEKNGANGRGNRRPGGSHGGGAGGRFGAGSESTRHVTICSDFAASRDLQKEILDEVIRNGFNDHSVFGIKLALEEAMINAIKHGNKLDMSKHVYVDYTITPEKAVIEIEDEGEGFVRQAVPDPTLEENLEKCCGRGILLIEAYMNTVEYSNGGRRLHMVKYNEADVLPRCKEA